MERAARPRAREGRARRGGDGLPRAGGRAVGRGRVRHRVRRLRDDRRAHDDRRGRARRRRPAARQAASSRPSTPPAAARSPTRATLECDGGELPRPGRATCSASAHDQVVALDARARRSSSPASASTRASTAPRGTRPPATTPPPTCSTPRCAGGSALTSTRPAPTSGPTSCASTSPTRSGAERRASCAAVAGRRSTPGSFRTTRCGR